MILQPWTFKLLTPDTKGNSMKHRINFLLIALLTLLMAACEATKADPIPFTSVQTYIETLTTGQTGSLWAKAVKASDVYSDLSTANYPLILIVFDNNTGLESYLEAEGLSQEAFLEHPRLTDFVKQHLFNTNVDWVSLRSEIGNSVTLQNAAGQVITLKHVKDSEGGQVKGGEINGVAVVTTYPIDKLETL